MSTHASALGSFRGSSPALDHRGWNLALAFQEVFTAIVRLRYNRQAVSNAESFRAQIKQALRIAEQEARSGGCNAEDVKQAIFALVAFLDESALSCRNPAFADWARLPLQAEMYGDQLAGEVFFQELQKTLQRSRLCGNRGFVGSLLLVPAARLQRALCSGGRLAFDHDQLQEKIRRVRGPAGSLSPRGGIPADAVRLVQTDPWIRRLGFACIVICLVALAIFLVTKFLLISGAAELSASATQFVK